MNVLYVRYWQEHTPSSAWNSQLMLSTVTQLFQYEINQRCLHTWGQVIKKATHPCHLWLSQINMFCNAFCTLLHRSFSKRKSQHTCNQIPKAMPSYIKMMLVLLPINCPGLLFKTMRLTWLWKTLAHFFYWCNAPSERSNTGKSSSCSVAFWFFSPDFTKLFWSICLTMLPFLKPLFYPDRDFMWWHRSRLPGKTSLPEWRGVCTWPKPRHQQPLSPHFLSSRASFLCDWEGLFISQHTTRGSLSPMIGAVAQRQEAGAAIILSSK